MERSTKPTKLLFSNIPAHCPDDYLRRWIEARSYQTFGVKLIRDQETGTSPSFAYVQLLDVAKLNEAARTLDGQTLWGSVIQVRRVVPVSSISRPAAWMKVAG